jgi:glycerophosphoryl diester phosphodiesterase
MPRLPSYSKPHILAHRMKAMGMPENTVLSLKEAINLGVDWVEFDVKVLADGEMVSIHDGLVNRTTNGSGDVTKMTLKEVRELNAGMNYSYGFVPVPTVEEIVSELSKANRFVRAEMHIHNLYEPEGLVNLLAKYSVQDRCYFNLNAVIVGEYMRNEMDVPNRDESLISLNVGAESPELKDLCNDLNLSYLCVGVDKLSESFVNNIHNYRQENPVFVHCYPVHNETDWQTMLDYGVDVIQTDFPAALMEFLDPDDDD